MSKPKSQITQENVGMLFRRGEHFWRLTQIKPPLPALALFNRLDTQESTEQYEDKWGEFVLQGDVPKRKRKAKVVEPPKPKRGRPKKTDVVGTEQIKVPYPLSQTTTASVGAGRAKLQEHIDANADDGLPYIEVSVAHEGEPYSVSMSYKGNIGKATGATLREAYTAALKDAGLSVGSFKGIDTPEVQAMREALK